ncbi:uncharacterized protein DUF2626 [Salsuginibacillus halophilus]|uniref:Uncharacterized protein DUF2626 n=1 Tax=Salsuginibacillus halophilus TaxID=517424 RepID=A0A2P8H7Y6_9BACI|nr:DUF2626 domain-containing protein [Salsuginibacillus halophilus]PSL42347.1 uncharacterized protein DUF2626 [Salsuginibacillus halophilus]
MDRMYRVLAFWTGIFAVLFFVGDMYNMSLFFFAQTAMFLLLGYMKLNERVYVYIFAAYLTVFFVGYTYYTSFLWEPPL